MQTEMGVAESEATAVRRRLADFPCLSALGLHDDDLEELAHQGSIHLERRGARTYRKLRFRRRGRQVVRSLGPDRGVAETVRQELAVLQTERKLHRQLRQIESQARQALRDAKRQLEPMLGGHGLAFHGLAIRRTRNQS